MCVCVWVGGVNEFFKIYIPLSNKGFIYNSQVLNIIYRYFYVHGQNYHYVQ